jgi:outer membrane protein insertion porin family
VLRIGGRFGWAGGIEGEDVPLFERFFPGGVRSVRGFDYRGIGPEVNGVRVGGRASWQATAEYSFPLGIPEVRGVALIDAADVEPRLEELGTSRIRVGAGGGIRLRLNVFHQLIPIDLYGVQAVSKERGDDTRIFGFMLQLGF